MSQICVNTDQNAPIAVCAESKLSAVRIFRVNKALYSRQPERSTRISQKIQILLPRRGVPNEYSEYTYS